MLASITQRRLLSALAGPLSTSVAMKIRSIYIYLYIHNLALTYLDPPTIHTTDTPIPVAAPSQTPLQPKPPKLPAHRTRLQPPPIQKPPRHVHPPGPQKLRHVLTQEIIRAATADAPIQMVVQQEMHGEEVRELESILPPRHPTISARCHSISCEEVGNCRIRCVRKDTTRRGRVEREWEEGR